MPSANSGVLLLFRQESYWQRLRFCVIILLPAGMFDHLAAGILAGAHVVQEMM
jgi:hypothetical protein